MHLRKLELRNYRSWRELNLELAPGVTVLVGRNGFGRPTWSKPSAILLTYLHIAFTMTPPWFTRDTLPPECQQQLSMGIEN